MSGGRPTLYDPSLCDEVIKLGKQGLSVQQMSLELGISTRSLFDYKAIYPEFSRALEEAQEYEMAWWENQAKLYMVEHKDSARLNTGLWSRSMAARFPKKYREQVKQEITGANDAPLLAGIQVTFVKPPDQR